MSSNRRIPDYLNEETGDDFIDAFRLHVRFTDSYIEQTRRVTDVQRGIRNALHIEQWSRGDELGRGGFGIVYLEKEGNGRVRAVKEVPKHTGGKNTMDHLREVLAMVHFTQEQALFVTLEGWYHNRTHLFLAMEYLPLGDLYTCVLAPLPESEARVISRQVTEAIYAMHQKSFTHRDIKPSNIFVVSKSPNWWVKVGDFGVSKRVRNDSTSLHTSIQGDYMAPEITGHVQLENEASCYTNAVDMWSLGCLIHWLLTKQLPLTAHEKLAYCMDRIQLPKRHLQIAQTSVEGTEFITRLLQPQHQKRLTAQDALKEEWPHESRIGKSPSVLPALDTHNLKAHQPASTDEMVVAQPLQLSPLGHYIIPKSQLKYSGALHQFNGPERRDPHELPYYYDRYSSQGSTENSSSEDLHTVFSRALRSPRPPISRRYGRKDSIFIRDRSKSPSFRRDRNNSPSFRRDRNNPSFYIEDTSSFVPTYADGKDIKLNDVRPTEQEIITHQRRDFEDSAQAKHIRISSQHRSAPISQEWGNDDQSDARKRLTQDLAGVGARKTHHIGADIVHNTLTRLSYQDSIFNKSSEARVENARLRELAKFESDLIASIDTTNTRDLQTLAPLTGVEIDRNLQVQDLERFHLTIEHSSGQQIKCFVDLLFRTGMKGIEELSIFEVENSCRKLLFPPILLISTDYVRTEVRGEALVLKIGDIEEELWWHELLLLRHEYRSVLTRWARMLKAPTAHPPYFLPEILAGEL